jgi:phosphatidate cytidylyltransferase
VSELTKRIITGLIAFGIFLGAIFVHQIGFLILFSVVMVVGLREYYDMVEKAGHYPQRITGIVLGLSLLWGNGAYTFFGLPERFLLIPVLCLFLILPIELYRGRKNPFTNIAMGVLGIVYIVIPLSLLVNIVVSNDSHEYRPESLVYFFMLIWASDTGAYFAGRAFGRRKLFERVSPKKTWEGFIGGAVLSMVVAAVLASITFFPDLKVWLGMSIVAVVMGTYGDLVESLLKRNVGVKDSGTLLPGHGGVLDRFDSILLASPFLFVYLKLFY